MKLSYDVIIPLAALFGGWLLFLVGWLLTQVL